MEVHLADTIICPRRRCPRFRAGRPRRLPTLTTVSVLELYSIFALGHIAHLEVNHLSRKAKEHPSLSVIQKAASWDRWEYHEHPTGFTLPTDPRERLDELTICKSVNCNL